MTLEDKVVSLDAANAVLFVTLALTVEELIRATSVELRGAVLQKWEADTLRRASKVADELPDTEPHRHGLRVAELMLREIFHNVRSIPAGSDIGEPGKPRTGSAP